ncbi:MAG: CoA transferase [Rhodospirillaceae bacterium]|nr:CoA transferase [Rhodospirillaceae bacterium]
MNDDFDAPGDGRTGPLGRFRVLDVTQVIAGPQCTMMLADLGADVVKVEKTGSGDEMRLVGPYKGRDGHQDYFNCINRSKRSIELDLKQERDRSVALALAAQADAFVENFSPGVAARLGLGWDALSAVNPRLVYCSISGFGQTGPYRDRVAVDPTIQALSGIMSVTGEPDGERMQLGAPLADAMSGMYAAYAIVGALHGVGDSGEGRFIDISMQDVMLAALGTRIVETLSAGVLPERSGNSNPNRVPAGVYRTSDGERINIICMNDRFWGALCAAIDREDLIDDPRYRNMISRRDRRDEVERIFTDAFATNTVAYWSERLDKVRAPFARVNDYAEALADPQVAHRGAIRELDHPTSGAIKVVGPPWQMTGPQPAMTAPPLLGQHGAEVLSDWLGWDDAQINEYRRAETA